MKKIPKKTFDYNFITTVYLSANSNDSEIPKKFENIAKKNKLNLDCLPININKSQICNIANVLTTTDVKAAIIAPEFSSIVFKLSDHHSKEAKEFKKVDFVVIDKGNITAHLLCCDKAIKNKTNSETITSQSLLKAIKILSKINLI